MISSASIDGGKYDPYVDRGVVPRFGRPEDVARVVRLLLEPDAYLTGQVITVDGGMPIQDHGLPTQPRVTREIAPGYYLLEGLRFHMPGSWELVITIETGDARDVVVIDLDI